MEIVGDGLGIALSVEVKVQNPTVRARVGDDVAVQLSFDAIDEVHAAGPPS